MYELWWSGIGEMLQLQLAHTFIKQELLADAAPTIHPIEDKC